MSIPYETFAEACQKVPPNTNEAHVVGQFSKVQDFMTFKQAMVRRNNQLNEEASKMFKQNEAYEDLNNQLASHKVFTNTGGRLADSQKEFMTEEERKDFELALKLQEDYGGEEEPY